MGEPRALGWDGFLASGDLPASRHLSLLGEAEFMSGLPGAGDCAWPAHPILCPDAGVTATSAVPVSRLGSRPGWVPHLPWAPLWAVTGVFQGTAHPRLTPKPRAQDSKPRVAIPQHAVPPAGRHGEGLAAWECFPRDSQHSSQVSDGRRTPRQPSLPLASA